MSFLKWVFVKKKGVLKHQISLPKKYIPRAVDRNRFRRWVRESLKQRSFDRVVGIFFLKQPPSFYKNLRRRDFDKTFNELIDQKPKT